MRRAALLPGLPVRVAGSVMTVAGPVVVADAVGGGKGGPVVYART